MSLYTVEQYDALIAANEPMWSEKKCDALDFLKANPAVGMPASFGIGSDSYAMTITGIEYFKTGARAGQVKSVTAIADEAMHAERFHMTKNGRLQKREEYESRFYGSLTIGYARDYRDPSF